MSLVVAELNAILLVKGFDVDVGKDWPGVLQEVIQVSVKRSGTLAVSTAFQNPQSPRGSSTQHFKDSGPKNHALNGFWDQGP